MRHKKVRIEDLSPEETKIMKQAAEISGFTGDDAHDEDVDRILLDQSLDELGAKMRGAALRRELGKVGGELGEHAPGRYSSKGWSPAFGGFASSESPLLASVRALAEPETLERWANEISNREHVRGAALDGKLLMESWFRHSTRVQVKSGPRTAESLRFLEAFDQIQKTDMGSIVDTSGGYAVPNVVANEVLKIIRDASQIFKVARQVTMTSDTLSFPDEATAVVTYWSASNATTLTAGEPVFGIKQLIANKLIGRAKFSLELIDDANVAIVPFLQSCFGEKMGGDLDSMAMEATYAAATLPFTGVLNATSVTTYVPISTNGTNGAPLKYTDLVNIFAAPGEGMSSNKGVYVCGPGVYAKILGLIDGQGQPIVRLGNVEGESNQTILGRPIIVSNRLVKTTVGAGTASVGAIYFGDPKMLVFGTRQGMRWDVTDQVSWATYQADARMVGRFGFVVGVPTAWVRCPGLLV